MAETENLLLAGSDESEDMSLLDLLDHVLNAGVVMRGSIVLSLAGVDLVYIALDVLLTSVETALKHMGTAPAKEKMDEQGAGLMPSRG